MSFQILHLQDPDKIMSDIWNVTKVLYYYYVYVIPDVVYSVL